MSNIKIDFYVDINSISYRLGDILVLFTKSDKKAGREISMKRRIIIEK